MSLSTKFMIALFAVCMVSIWVLSLIRIFMNLTVAPKFGFRCCTISGFGLICMNEDGKWKCKKDRFSPLIQEMLVIDISKPIQGDIDKKDWQYTLLCNLLKLIIAIFVFVLLKDQVRATMEWDDVKASELFLGAFAYGMVLHSVVHLITGFYTRLVLMKRLAGYVDVMLKKMRQGMPFEAMDLKPVSQLPYKKPNQMEKMMYYTLYIPYLISIDDIEGMREPIKEMTEYFAKREFILQETLSYYWLIFYYSRYDIQPTSADAFFSRASGSLLNDADANAKRVLAYYYYGVKNDVEKARQYIKEGLAVIDKFSLPGAERELERKLLLDLDAIILRRLAYEQDNNEKI